MRVGAIGLGIGTVAAYSRTGDVYRFYELNPAVIRLAQGEKGYFSFLRDAPGRIEIVPGDARLSLEGEAAGHNFQNFDVLIVDAFNGDSIPIHLLTREAMRLYLSHLRGPDSVIAVHISNRAVDLAPVVAALAKLYGLQATQIFVGSDTQLTLSNNWILLGRGGALKASQITNIGHPLRATAGESTAGPITVWTDDYSNIITLFAHG
jgi:hypothetical protein